MAKKKQHLLVLSTCQGKIIAKNIANELITNNLAACVQLVPDVQSFFCWAGKIDSSDEILLLIKTTTDCYEELEQKLRSMHPYELPEIIAVSISIGFNEYLSWINDNTK